MSFFSHLVCSVCQCEFNPHQVQTHCTSCNAPLLAFYNLSAARQELDRDSIHARPSGMWRWRELLPVFDDNAIVSLGEGDTPLLHLARLGDHLKLNYLYIKDESLNPTGSFKARGISAAVSKAKELGIKNLIIPTAGNAGGALAAYAARGGLKSCIIMPKDTPISNLQESRIADAEIILVDGLISDAARVAGKKAQLEGWFDVSTFKEPYRTEGKKIMGYELAETLNWDLPDVIIYPTGGGTGLVGMWKAFTEMEKLGWLKSSRKPRMISVQASGCAPVVQAIETGSLSCDFWTNAHTIASGLRVPKSFADTLMLQIIRESDGTAVAVDDVEIVSTQKLLASTEGIFSAPEGAATLAGLIKLIRTGVVFPHEKIILFNTASGLKYLGQ